MKLLTIKQGDQFRPAVMIGEEVLDLIAASEAVELDGVMPSSMKQILAGGEQALKLVSSLVEKVKATGLSDQFRSSGALISFDAAELGPVVDNPQMVLSGSMNSWGHLNEMEDVKGAHPCAFQKVPSSLSCSGADILLPPGHDDTVDWEGELCVVIGKRCHNVSIEEASDYIMGYTLMNDVSTREFAMEFIVSGGKPPVAIAQAWERNVLGKNYPTFCPIGPVITTADEFPEPLNYHLETVVNGEVMQSSTQEDLVYNTLEMVSYFSQFYIFEPGDVFSMGSPPGVGMAMKPPRYLKAGDVVEVRCDKIGTLSNTVRAQ